jgi:hypothetical protein
MEGGKLSEEREREKGGESIKKASVLPCKQPLPSPRSASLSTPRCNGTLSSFFVTMPTVQCSARSYYIYNEDTAITEDTDTHPPSIPLCLPVSLSPPRKVREGKGLHLTCSRSATDNEDTARRLLLLPRGGGAPPEEAPVGGRGTIPRRVRGGHVGGAARRPGGVDPRLRRRDRRVAGRPRRRHAHVRASSGSDQVAWAEEWVGIMVF